MTADPLRALVEAVEAARSCIGAVRPDARHDPEDALQWDRLTAAADRLRALSQAGVVDGWVRLPRGDAEKLARFAANNAGNGLRSEVSAAGRRVQAMLAAAGVKFGEQMIAAPAVVVDEAAVAWRVRVYHKHTGRPHLDHWSRWQIIDKNSYDRTKAEGAYHEYDTFELQELGVIAAAPAAQGVESDQPNSRYAIVSALEYLRVGDSEQAVSMLESALSSAAAPAVVVDEGYDKNRVFRLGDRVIWQSSNGQEFPAKISRVNYRVTTYDARLDDGSEAIDFAAGRFRHALAAALGQEVGK